eukprot:Gb_27046 [translate_table: standard]
MNSHRDYVQSSEIGNQMAITFDASGFRFSADSRLYSFLNSLSMPPKALVEACRARVVWDEVNLGEIEANKPPRQKIDEPKTPYHAVEYEDDKGTALDYASHAEAIRSALSQFASSSSERGRRGRGLTTSGDEAEDMEQDEEG